MSSYSMTCRRAVALAVCFLCVRLWAQQSVTSGVLGGYVQDADGRAVERAVVTVIYKDRGQSQSAVSDAAGRFRFLAVAPGNYEVKVMCPLFAPRVLELTVETGQSVDLQLTLELAALSETVTVTERGAVIETDRTQISDRVSTREIDRLPLNGRNYLDLALLVPGVSRTNTGAPQQFAETSAVPGTGLSISGQRNLNNAFIVDGMSANDDAADLAGAYFTQEVIRDFQVINTGGSAEFGRASAGVLNIATRSGTNDWHGRFYGFARNQRFDARNAMAKSKDPLTQAQYGASLAGPVRRNQTFLFSNFEQTRRHAAGFVTIAEANVAAINATLDRAAYPGGRVAKGEFPTGYNGSSYFARLDHTLTAAHQLALRYNAYAIDSANARSVGGLNAVSRGTALRARDHSLAISETAALSPWSVNELRVQYVRSRLAAPPNEPAAPAVNVAGVANFGASTSSPTARDNGLLEVNDAVSLQRGGHFLRAGAQFLYNRVNIAFPGALYGVYTFSSLANLQAGRYITYQQAFGDAGQFQSNPNSAFFVQDEWKPRPDLALNFGLRHEAQFLPSPVRTHGSFAPRFGVAFSPGDRRTVVRASYGIYTDRIPLRATSNALQRDGIKYRVATLAFGQAGAPVFPGRLSAFPPQPVNITAIDPGIRGSYSQQAGLQVERELGRRLSVSAGYQWLRGLHLILSRNVNVPTLTASDAAARGIPNLGRPDARYGNVSRYESSGDSYSNGLVLSVKARPARWADVRVSYNYSKAIDNAGNFFFSAPQDNFNLRDDRGLSDNDQRHRLSVSGLLERYGWRLAPMFVYSSPLPFNVQTGTDRNFDTNANDRPAGVGRNTGRGFAFLSLDCRLSRVFRLTDRLGLEGLVEGFNVLNRTNRLLPNNIFGPGAAPLATFGQPAAAGDPRQVQVGLRFDF